MSYITYHRLYGPLAYVDAPAYLARPEEGMVFIPCEKDADVNDTAHWEQALTIMQETGMPAPTQALSYEYLQGMFTDLIQRHLDEFAKSEGKAYDNMLSLCTYATSSNPVFSAEGQYGVAMRDVTWAAAHAILNAVVTGERPIPSWEELKAELPPLVWPQG